jgi:hypothetical protein
VGARKCTHEELRNRFIAGQSGSWRAAVSTLPATLRKEAPSAPARAELQGPYKCFILPKIVGRSRASARGRQCGDDPGCAAEGETARLSKLAYALSEQIPAQQRASAGAKNTPEDCWKQFIWSPYHSS